MVDNPTKIYNDYVRANLPNSMSYDTGTDRYDINSHSFFKFKNSNWYFNYISKYGYSALSAYAVNNFEPALVFDFKGNYFRKSATDSTFGASITHAATTNATMVDSDGLLKWRPHNLLPNSSVLNYSKIGTATSTSTVVSPSGLQDAVLVQPTVASGITWVYDLTIYNTGVVTTISTFAKASGKSFVTMSNSNGTFVYASFNLTTGAVGTVASGYTANIEDFGNGWYRCSVTTPTGFNDRAIYAVSDTAGGIAASANGNDGILLYGAQLNRSDLGGMVNNPDTTNSYVPTTTAAVYAPRRGHHIYNGSAWVNEGILHESEARTNLMTSSGDLSGTGWTGGAYRGAVTTGSPFGTYHTLSTAGDGTNMGPAQRYQIGKPLASGATYIGYSLVKYSAGSGWFGVNMYNTGSKGDEQAYFDLQNGVVGSKAALIIDHGMIDYGDGWWLCWASSASSTTSGGMSVELPNGDGVQTCSAGDVILIAGTQFELGATPSSYIPTLETSITRAAETLTVPAANLPWPTPVETTGTELVTNGKFGTDTAGWASGASAATSAAVSGEMQVTNVSSNGRVVTAIPTVVGRRYEVSGVGRVISGVGGPAASLYLTNSTGSTIQGGNINYTATDAPLGLFFTATATTSYISAITFGNVGNVSAFDNVSVKEINPLALSIQMDGKMTYAADGSTNTALPWRWRLNSSNILYNTISTAGTRTGQPRFVQSQTTSGFDEVLGANNVYTPDTNVPFNFAGRYGSTFLNGAHEGTLLTANTTPTILPDLSSTDLELGYLFMGTIGEFRMWSDDLGDVGITEATLPSTEPSLSLTFDGSENSFIVLDWSE